MIWCCFRIENPFRVKDYNQVDYISYNRRITTNKSFNFQLSKTTKHTIFEIEFDTRWIGQSHAGIKFGLHIFGYFLYTELYDNRHWDHDEHCWEKYDEEENDNVA